MTLSVAINRVKKLALCGHISSQILTLRIHALTNLSVLGSLLLKSNSLHITLYFEEGLYITVTYYLEIKVTSNILD